MNWIYTRAVKETWSDDLKRGVMETWEATIGVPPFSCRVAIGKLPDHPVHFKVVGTPRFPMADELLSSKDCYTIEDAKQLAAQFFQMCGERYSALGAALQKSAELPNTSLNQVSRREWAGCEVIQHY